MKSKDHDTDHTAQVEVSLEDVLDTIFGGLKAYAEEQTEEPEEPEDALLTLTVSTVMLGNELEKLLHYAMRHIDIEENKRQIAMTYSRILTSRGLVAEIVSKQFAPPQVAAFHSLIPFPSDYDRVISDALEAIDMGRALAEGTAEINIIERHTMAEA